MSEIVREDGLVRLPEAVREQLGITPGMAVDFETDAGGKVVVVKSDGLPRESRFARWRGTATAGLSTDEIMAMTRGEE
ncbi:AbrB/MazE/SpoVT family DNA-binding domain-containing protein [Tianweitania populi]|uniref:AbrB family transcriptional regulator n=1 Tax=Tianweitania populi TaxID=1607949 RepID=A0A8J3GL45_9HYPH|nr:AbrB/MazE/SpoVT family DNA-binding domain-containing protein [Tianweitania populi]GHD16376.1 AbrB family transcriptional regulator [Tianweitania populi]